VELPHPPLLTEKKTLLKKININLSSLLHRAPFTTSNFFNLIELSVPYTKGTPSLKKKPNLCSREKKKP